VARLMWIVCFDGQYADFTSLSSLGRELSIIVVKLVRITQSLATSGIPVRCQTFGKAPRTSLQKWSQQKRCRFSGCFALHFVFSVQLSFVRKHLFQPFWSTKMSKTSC
jgi:hypothetical protein